MISGLLIISDSLSAKSKIEKGGDDEDEVKSTISSDPYAGGGHKTSHNNPAKTSSKSTDLVSLNEKDGKINVVQPIRFDDKNNLAIESQGIVLKIVDVLKKNPQARTRIIVHTDSLGSDQKNIENSQKRAQALGVYLIQSGIDMSRFELVGMGDRELIASDDTREGRQKNNRVDFLLITPIPTQTTPPTPPPPPPAAPVTPPVPETPPATITPPAPPAPAAPAIPSPTPTPAPAPVLATPPAVEPPQNNPPVAAPIPAPTAAPLPSTPTPSPIAPLPTPPPPTPAPTQATPPAPIQVPPPPVAK